MRWFESAPTTVFSAQRGQDWFDWFDWFPSFSQLLIKQHLTVNIDFHNQYCSSTRTCGAELGLPHVELAWLKLARHDDRTRLKPVPDSDDQRWTTLGRFKAL